MSLVQVKTNLGDFTISLNEERAPKSCENFLAYVNSGHYDGTIFHRVIDRFMIQGGHFKAGMKKQDTNDPIQNEAKNGLKNEKYAIAMARTMQPHSASDQFFINTKDNDFLNYPGQDGWGYAVFGKVVEGTDVIDKIGKVRTTRSGMHSDVPAEDVVILSAKVVTEANPNPVVSFQVVPVIDDGKEVTAQFEGPTDATTGWAVYGRTKDGLARFLKDFPDETQAMDYAVPAAAGFGVEIEPQPWKSGSKLTDDLGGGGRAVEIHPEDSAEEGGLPEMANDFNDELLAVYSFGNFLSGADLSKYGEQVVAAQRQVQEANRNLYLLLNNKVAELDQTK